MSVTLWVCMDMNLIDQNVCSAVYVQAYFLYIHTAHKLQTCIIYDIFEKYPNRLMERMCNKIVCTNYIYVQVLYAYHMILKVYGKNIYKHCLNKLHTLCTYGCFVEIYCITVTHKRVRTLNLIDQNVKLCIFLQAYLLYVHVHL